METRRYRFIYNLNELRPNWSKQKPLETNKANLTVYFQDIELHLIEHISKATLVVGCVAWLTNSRVLRALAQVPKGVSILVQKEDFLRPDANVNGDWKNALKKNYQQLPTLPFWPDTLNIVSDAINGDIFIESIRCLGITSSNRKKTIPRLHHKFLVFCRLQASFYDSESQTNIIDIVPYAVWTGSYNITHNATNSLENALYIEDLEVANAYYWEWQQLAWFSEPLDWTSEWIEPNWSST